MALTTTEQELYDFARESLPEFLFAEVRAEEELNAFVKVFDGARAQIAAYFVQGLIEQATGAGADYLNQHARDQGTARGDGETDVALRARLRSVEDAITRAAVIAAAQAVITADGGPPLSVRMTELRRHRAFFVRNEPDFGTTGTFTTPDGSDVQLFTPATPFARAPYQDSSVPEAWDYELVTSGFAAGNNGVFAITGLVGDACQFVNAGGSAETVAGDWRIQRHESLGNNIEGEDDVAAPSGTGLPDAFMQDTTSDAITDRMAAGGQPSAFVLILPLGTTAATAASVVEGIRLKRAAGIRVIVERRQ